MLSWTQISKICQNDRDTTQHDAELYRSQKKGNHQRKSCNAELLSCQPDLHPSSGFMAGLLQSERARRNRARQERTFKNTESVCRHTNCQEVKQHAHTSPGLTFMTSTCRSSWRDGVTLMASNIWLSSCFSRTSTSMVTPPTNLSSHSSFWLETKTFYRHTAAHFILYSKTVKTLLVCRILMLVPCLLFPI